MEKKMIVLDLDGTLLNDSKIVTIETKNVLNMLSKMGHKIIIATGRSLKLCEDYYIDIGIKDPIISFNGGLIYSNNSIWENFHKNLDLEVAKNIINFSMKNGAFNIIAESINSLHLSYPNKVLDKMKNRLSKYSTSELYKNLTFAPSSMIITAEKKVLQKIAEYIDNNYPDSVTYRRWRDSWELLEITKIGVNKLEAIKEIANYYSICKENIIAFGDEDNDLEMIEFAGIGVAMGNANKAIKSMADVIIDTNNNNGIANYLVQKFNLKENILI